MKKLQIGWSHLFEAWLQASGVLSWHIGIAHAAHMPPYASATPTLAEAITSTVRFGINEPGTTIFTNIIRPGAHDHEYQLWSYNHDCHVSLGSR